MIVAIVFGPHAESADVEAHGSFFETLFHAAGVWAPLTLGVLAIAFAVNIARLVRDFNRRVNGVALATQLKKLIAAGNAERAVKLCHAAETAVASQVALAGLNARMHNADAYAAMLDVRARFIAQLKMGVTIAVVLGVAALIESAVMIGEAVSKGFPGAEIGAIAILPAILACLVLINAMQWSGMKRDMDAIIDAVR